MPEKKWVFDSVSICNFLLSDSCFILENRYKGRAIISSQVYDEIAAGILHHPTLNKINDLISKRIFEIYTLSEEERELYVKMSDHLCKGEASSIAAAKIQSYIVVTDDRAARKQCVKMNVLKTGSVGILKADVLEGRITLKQADVILNKMITAGFYSPVRRISDIM
ncbi:hypothetical protein ACFLZM_04995 [Thermodesulfobacteriota bacterium]